MKQKILIILLLLTCVLIIPAKTFAEEKKYTKLNLHETLADEEIEEAFTNYKETSDQITIYLFRGKGCGFCKAFLTFLNSITDEYGKYFKLESYEVWNNSNNSSLMKEISGVLNQDASGVPYIIIGDKVFPGYTDSYNEDIKEAITKLYNTKKKNRYDVFEELKKQSKNKSSVTTSNGVIIWGLIFTLTTIFIVISYINLKYKQLEIKIDSLINNKEVINHEHLEKKTQSSSEHKKNK